MSTSTTDAPSSRNRNAVSLPMPPDPPVMTATLSCNRFMRVVSMCGVVHQHGASDCGRQGLPWNSPSASRQVNLTILALVEESRDRVLDAPGIPLGVQGRGHCVNGILRCLRDCIAFDQERCAEPREDAHVFFVQRHDGWAERAAFSLPTGKCFR